MRFRVNILILTFALLAAILFLSSAPVVAQSTATPYPTYTFYPTYTKYPTYTPGVKPAVTTSPAAAPTIARGTPTFLPTIANDKFGSIDSPIPVGQSVALTVNKQDFTVGIIKIWRGDDAWALIKVSSFNSLPKDPAKEYLLAQVQITYDDGIGSLDVRPTMFNVVTGGEILNDILFVSPPTPEFRFTLLKGITRTGYLVKEVFADDPAPLLMAVSNMFSKDGIYFATK